LPFAFAVLASAIAHRDIEATHDDSETEAFERALELHPERESWKDANYERAETKSGRDL
jgi:hypothetical protein